MKYYYNINKVSRGKTLHFSLLLTIFALLFTSCSDWLDVKPEDEEREEDMFSTYENYKDALAGCYSIMAGTDLYGRRLTMADIEDLACLWSEPSRNGVYYNDYAQYYLWHHQYNNDYCLDAFKAIYQGLYNVAAQANMVISHIGENGTDVIKDPASRNVIQGEAYALRAFVHFDVLRLFGQMPGGTNQISLPYSLQNDIHEHASYYTFDQFVTQLESDLDQAEQLLDGSDPIQQYSITSLNQQGEDPVTFDDDFLEYRQFRLNYFAVKAIKARLYLYTGQTQKAHDEAMSIINAKVAGEPFIELSGIGDIQSGYYNLPDECIFALSNRNIADYAFSLLGGGSDKVSDNNLYVTTDMLEKQLYNGKNTASDNRYLSVWNRQTVTITGITRPTTRKYYYDTNSFSTASQFSTLLTKKQVMPLIRLSEMYLIAMETTTDLSEANSLYKTYMASHNVNITDDFASLSAVHDELVGEYRREFYAEGVMFYVYKRLGIMSQMFNPDTMTESLYEIPVPTSEYDSEK